MQQFVSGGQEKVDGFLLSWATSDLWVYEEGFPHGHRIGRERLLDDQFKAFLQASFADPVGQFHTQWRNNKGKGRPDKSGRESEILRLLRPSVVLCFSMEERASMSGIGGIPNPPSFFLIDLGRRLLLTFFFVGKEGK